MNRISFLAISLMLSSPLFLFSDSAQARVIYFGSEPETITLSYGGPTLFRFPSEVRTISQATRFQIEPANGDTPNYALLSIRPRFTTGTSAVSFILTDGTIIRTRLAVVTSAASDKHDTLYEFKSKETLLGDESASKTGSNVSELELMKALLRDDSVIGYETRPANQTIETGFKHLEGTIKRIYRGSQFNGYIVELVNLLKGQRLALNVQNLSLGEPNLAILSSSDSSVLEPSGDPGSRTYLRIVAKPSALQRQLILPVQMIEKSARKPGGGL